MSPLWPQTLGGICFSWFYHTWLIIYLWPSLSLCRLFRPHGLISYFDVPRSSIKNTFLFLYVTFKAILACIHNVWPQTHLHRYVCKMTIFFGFLLIWVRITWLLAFQMPWECSDSTLHYLFGVLYKEPLGHIEGEKLKSKKTIVHCCLNFSYTWVYIPLSLGAHSVLPKLAFSLWACYREIEDWSGGGLGFFGS